MSRVIVAGAVANKCGSAGATWTRFSYVLGFQKLGFDVVFIEQIDPAACLDAEGSGGAAFEECRNRAYFEYVVERFDLGGRAALVLGEGEQTCGLSYDDVLELAKGADLLVNISGHLSIGPLKNAPRRKVFIDQDPGFTQFWYVGGEDPGPLGGHDAYFTIGENVGLPECSVPTGGIDWRPTRQPLVLEHWPAVPSSRLQRFTTVGSWRGPYGPIRDGDVTHGVKVHEFRKFITLPRRVAATFEIALDIHPADAADLELLRRNGWGIVAPKEVVPDPDAFRRYVQQSDAEFSVAQGVYVGTHSGWFSDRTIRYLASGRPALVQDTGFSRNYAVGEGLVSFRTLDEAIEGAESLVRDYDEHCRAARAFAEEYFDSDKVLGSLVAEIDVAP